MTTTTSFTPAALLPENIMGGGDPLPIAIGARGTVGNLVMKEIEYFRTLESCRGDAGGDHDKNHRGGGGSNFWPSFGFLTITWRKAKRKGGSGRFLPRMCTVVDVAESRHHNHHRLNKISSFGYRNLKDDVHRFDV